MDTAVDQLDKLNLCVGARAQALIMHFFAVESGGCGYNKAAL